MTLLHMLLLPSDYPITKVETVTIIKIDFQGSEDKATIKNAVNFLRKYNFSSQDTTIQRTGKSLLRTTYSKYYQSGYINAEEYELIRIISKDDWLSVRQALVSLVKHANTNTLNKVTGSPWLMELISPDPDVEEYTPIELPMLGFALRLSYTRECDDITEGCLLATLDE